MPAPIDRAHDEDEQRHLVPLLLVMTVVTGNVDAVSILRLGRVFVANMTGNVTFLGFALGGASGFSVSASVVALAAFLGGAALGGRALRRLPKRDKLHAAAAAEAALVAVAAVVAASSSGTGARYTMTVLLGVAMGTQNAIVRSLAVPDLTTTVLTLTLTGIADDPPRVLQKGAPIRRRTASVGTMLVGAIVGAVLVLNASTAWALVAPAALLGLVAAAPEGWPLLRHHGTPTPPLSGG